MTKLDDLSPEFEAPQDAAHISLICVNGTQVPVLCDTLGFEANDIAYNSNPDNPYSLSLECDIIKDAVAALGAETLYIDSSSYPDIGDFIVHKLDGRHPANVISKALEGGVMSDDWKQSPEQSQQEAAAFEDNSIFFLVLDNSDSQNPKPAASLRIADCLQGASETVQYYKAVQAATGQEMVLPADLTVTQNDQERGLWDVVGVMAPKGYRNGNATAWAYHALYKASQEYGVHRWISNITDSEFKNLDALGIPFKLIEGTQKAEMPREGKDPILFGFYTINVDDIRPNMTQVIKGLETAAEQEEKYKKFYLMLAKLSRIAMDGQFTVE